jgi:MFS family permease
MSAEKNEFLFSTRSAYIWTRLLDTPFWGLFNLIPLILYKDLHATPLQLAVIITLKPLVSILSSYWSAYYHKKQRQLVPGILLARVMAFLPFLLIPFFYHPWYLISVFGLFMFLQMGMMPAWMELLKQNLPAAQRDKVFSYMQAFGYLGGGLLPFALGWALDEWAFAWRLMFPIVALIGLSSLFWQISIKVKPTTPQSDPIIKSHLLLSPWKSAWKVLYHNRSFAKFQAGFMLIGSGLMIIQPVLPVFFVDQLNLSYTEVGVAITLCKGIGFALGSPIWLKSIQSINIFLFGSIVAILAMFFPIFLILAKFQTSWLFLAYLLYGLMQAGNELSWNMSGPIFAGKEEDSSPFSSVNVMAVGIRGLFIPSIGALCLSQFGSSAVILVSGFLCLLASIKMAFDYFAIKHSLVPASLS